MIKYLITMAMLCLVMDLTAHTLSGSVKDHATGEPLAGAHIKIVGSGLITTTDAFGRFAFTNAPAGEQTIEITYIGYDKLVKTWTVDDENDPLVLLMHQGHLDLGAATIRAAKATGINTIGQIDIALRPINSAQDILRVVPGLFIAQHAGGGKAEQIFLRGFDIDHGTDIALSVDGMPVNMVSHAHGQGYADLHFVIPETIRNIDWDKGPYYADKGNFTTAGYVDFQTKDVLDESMVKLEAGLFDTYRAVSMLNLGNKVADGTRAYIASEFLFTNGPFESPQQFNRLNLMAKLRHELSSKKTLTLTASSFSSRWDASGQIPQRAVENGLISRFGAIDDREGGNTSRQNLNLKLSQLMDKGAILEHQVFISHYDFTLFSNFTFFLEDSINGDEIRQHEDRYIFGYKNEFETSHRIGEKTEFITKLGGTLRHDRVRDIGLTHTRSREVTLKQLALGDIDETNAGVYTEGVFEIDQKFRLTGGLRYDAFNFSYGNRLDSMYDRTSETKSIFSPKLTASYQFTPRFELFAKAGTGFHSNDTRVVVARNASNILPRAIGADLGANLKPLSRMLLHVTAWYLFLEQEFVYVGDAGIVEPSGRTERKGLEVSFRYQLLPWLYADADLNYSRAAAVDEAETENYIPLAPDFTSIGGLSVKMENGIRGSLRYRYMDDRPANGNGSITAEGYLVLDATLSYEWRNCFAVVTAENLLSTEWNEAQFATESRLPFEHQPMEELHFTPGTPFFVKAGVGVKF